MSWLTDPLDRPKGPSEASHEELIKYCETEAENGEQHAAHWRRSELEHRKHAEAHERQTRGFRAMAERLRAEMRNGGAR